MVSEDEVISKFYDPFHVVRVALLEKQEKFGFYSCLVVILLLILHQLDRHKLLMLMIKALDNLSKCSFTNHFN
jgi:hypothetical protein